MAYRQSNLVFDLVGKIYTPIVVYVWVVATLVAAISGPFGTFSKLDFPDRLFYWAVIVGVSILAGRAVRILVEERFARQPIWLRELVSITTIVPILTAVIWMLSPHLLGPGADGLPRPAYLAGYVLTVAAIVAGLRQARHQLFPDLEDASKDQSTRLLERLPREMRGEIYRLTGQDHHVQFVTAMGETTIRMRFSDAIALMQPVTGYCTHRSHWVTHAAISGVEREPGKTFLRLVNGDRVPVSRKYRPGLEKAGIV